MPIVYCSEPFEAMTGYTWSEIRGRNCRFLQSPDGNVTPGAKREYTDDKTVFDLKTKVSAEETQVTILNYTKAGIPFENILTTIPIRWDDDEIRYVVGFQKDSRVVFPRIPSTHE
jgi:PAS domain-containing protein